MMMFIRHRVISNPRRPTSTSQNDATRSRTSGARSYRSISAARARAQQAINQLHVAVGVDQRDRQTDGRIHDVDAYRVLCGQRQ